jgi:hypothetical protein
MVGIDDDVGISPRCYDRGNEKQRGSSIFNPVAAESLRDGHVVKVIPTWKQGRIDDLAGNVIGHARLDESGGAWRRFSIGMNKNLDHTKREARARVDRRQSRRIPPLTK